MFCCIISTRTHAQISLFSYRLHANTLVTYFNSVLNYNVSVLSMQDNCLKILSAFVFTLFRNIFITYCESINFNSKFISKKSS